MAIDMARLQDIVREAGKLLLNAHVSEDGIDRKQGDANFVTVYDVRIQRFLMEKLRGLVPDAAFFGEEDTEGNQAGRLGDGYTFVIDPIDGTTNFMFRYHHSCISVGVAWAGRLVAGCIYNPYVDEMYTAVRGQGCYLTGRRLQMEALSVEQGIVAFGCARYNAEDVDLLFNVVKTMFHRSLSIRSSGSAALDLSRIASGSNAAYIELLLHPYDYAAAAVMIEEAGGCIVQMDGSPITLDSSCSILAGTKTAVTQILETIREETAKME